MTTNREKVCILPMFSEKFCLPRNNFNRKLMQISILVIFSVSYVIIGVFPKYWLIIGMMIQFQLILSLLMTLIYLRIGCITALIFNFITIIQSTYRLTVDHSYGSQLVFILSIDTIMSILVISYFIKMGSQTYFDLLKKEEIVSKSFLKTALSEEELWKKNKQLKKLNKTICHDKEEMHRLAYIDSLTNLPNRRMFRDHLNKMVNSSNTTSNFFALVFIDLDNFKNVNDTFGHQSGDELIRHISFRLRQYIDPSDMLAHLGGDEFVLVIQRLLSHKNIIDYLTSLAVKLREPVMLRKIKITISASFGISIYPQDSNVVEEILKKLRHSDV
ncbi:GGDEF domain-containing protein [Sporolactobacillus putidus]|uniref:GGDEF domain-containing protein n=1 Tax=Sporolactobacillus putidus TaxID=492735 RepID=A0A917W3B2_9BACL|nr:GGDEF domain-containing protein [Sporolactobacillus putidus]GGL57498.1 hypothetical protein GCM10007968_21880 [Sporolactobacillus putidus]